MRITIGRIGRPHGVTGELTVEVRTDEPDELFVEGAQILVADQPMTIEHFRWHNQRGLMRLSGVEDRNAAELVRNALIEIDRPEDLIPVESDTFYDHNLIGCSVEDAAGIAIGVVTDVVHVPGQDLLVVTLASAREVFVPFVAAMVPMVDVRERRIVIDPPPGLLEP
jgi:16S rRNA processing protein RimM